MDSSIKKISLDHKDFPSLLKEIPNPPSQLFIFGSLPSQDQIKIAMVGTRKATDLGKKTAKEIARKLSSLNIVIVSGLAMGIDTAAHQGALEANGKTIAVLANGLDKIYPSQNENLAKQIIEKGGALISEYPEKTPSYPNQFLERNRIISGLCAATIIIEAPERSGSLATARNALEQGREVFVVPGPANHPNYIGSHKLIRDGARLITSIEDVLEDLGLEIPIRQLTDQFLISGKTNSAFDENQKLILIALKESGEPLNVDKICQLTKLSSQTVNQIVATLVIQEFIKETESGYTI